MGEFSSIAIDEGDVQVIGASSRVSAMFIDLDISWTDVERTTIGVMLAVMACSSDREVATKALSGMLVMMSAISNAHCSTLGWQVDPIDHDEMRKKSDEIDASGVELAGKVNGLGAAVMVGLLQELPPRWSQHMRQVVETQAMMTKVLRDSVISRLTSELVAAQVKSVNRLRQVANRTVFSPNSRQSQGAREWAVKAGKVYEVARGGGHHIGSALAVAVAEAGFPGRK